MLSLKEGASGIVLWNPSWSADSVQTLREEYREMSSSCNDHAGVQLFRAFVLQVSSEYQGMLILSERV